MSAVTLVCWKWTQEGFRNTYTAAHVNRLYEMVKRNTTEKFRFICVTDDPEGIRPEVITHKIWPNPVPHYGDSWKPNCFVRLRAFSEQAKEIFGEYFIWLDLDALIIGNIDHILQCKDDFRIWFVDGEHSKCNGSLVAHRAGTRTNIWDTFDPASVDSKNGFRNIGFVGSDQAWIAQTLTDKDKFFGQAQGVYSYRCHLEGKPLPPEAAIIFFHGEVKPEDCWSVGWIRRVLESLDEKNPAEDPAHSSRRVVSPDKMRFVTWLWEPRPGQLKKYGAQQVNMMQAMLDRHYKKQYELVCVTDNPAGLDGAVRTVPLWNDFNNLPHPNALPNVPICYRRLKVFDESMRDLIAPRFTSIDLDTVIISDVTDLFSRKDDFRGYYSGNTWAPVGGCLFTMNAGARQQVWDRFKANPQRMIDEARERGFAGTDQAIMGSVLGMGEKVWTDQDGVYQFRRLGYTEEARPGQERRRRPQNERQLDKRSMRADQAMRLESRRQQRKGLPENCKIVMFNGQLKPWDDLVWRYFSWVRKNYQELP